LKRKPIALIKETRQRLFVKTIMDAIADKIELSAGMRVAIKINLSGPKEIYANTHYETVEDLIFYLKDKFGIQDISVIEGSDGAFYSGRTTWDIFYKFRYKEVELNGAKLVNLDDLEHNQKLKVKTIYGDKEVFYTKFDSDYMISVVPPKTFNIFPVFLSIPNLIGFVRPEDRAFMFGASFQDLKKLNSLPEDKYLKAIIYSAKNFVNLFKNIRPSLVLIDGLYGMEGKGPVKGSPVFHGFSVASEDALLVDSLTTYLMGFDVNDIPYIYFGFREGLGNNRWQNVIGVDPPQVKFPYRPHPLYQKMKKWKDFYQKNKNLFNGYSSNNNKQDKRF